MTDIVVPAEQEGTKAVLKNWLKKPGELVRKNEPVCEIETDKVAVEIAAASDGVLAEILVEAGADIAPGRVLGRISQRPRSAEKAMDAGAGIVASEGKAMELGAGTVAPAGTTAEEAPGFVFHGRWSQNPLPNVPLPPGIRRLLAEHNLKPEDIPLHGAHLSREDIEAEIARRAGAPAMGVTIVPLDRMRKRIAEHMTNSLLSAPHVTALVEADFSAIVAHRAAHKDAFAREGAHLTFTAYFVAASAEAMKAVPEVNARWREDRIELFEDVNVGVATALGEKGLIVPVIHRVQKMSLVEVARRLAELTERARARRLALGEVQNGTFSISNHGVSGSLLAAPIIINQPQAAILGVGKVEKRAVVRADDRIEARPMAYVTLTIDHRVLDAYQSNTWLARFVEILENWK